MPRFPMLQPVTEMTKRALGELLAPGVRQYLDMFHDHAVFEFPFDTGGHVRIEGTAAMAAYLEDIEGTIVFDQFDLTAVHRIGEYGMVLEYGSQAHLAGSNVQFRQRYITVITTSAGRIDLYREYFNPLNIPDSSASP